MKKLEYYYNVINEESKKVIFIPGLIKLSDKIKDDKELEDYESILLLTYIKSFMIKYLVD